MKIGLIDVDSHNYPNLCLMKISAYFKTRGAEVEFCKQGGFYDRVYISKIFTESKEPDIQYTAAEVFRGGSGYDLENKLTHDIEHTYPDYGLYPELTKDTAFGWLTRGCPRLNHAQSRGGFCITPDKDGCKSIKVADLKEFWDGQKNIVLYDQNLLACKDRLELLRQLTESKAQVTFDGGMDIRYFTPEIEEALREIKVKDYHFAWDDPKEKLKQKFQYFKETGLKSPDKTSVYVLVNFWSTTEEDLMRVYTLREMGFIPYIMVYDKQKFVDEKGRWLPGVERKYSRQQLEHFKICHHMQRWCNSKRVIKLSPNFRDYEPLKIWEEKGKPVPLRSQLSIFDFITQEDKKCDQ